MYGCRSPDSLFSRVSVSDWLEQPKCVIRIWSYHSQRKLQAGMQCIMWISVRVQQLHTHCHIMTKESGTVFEVQPTSEMCGHPYNNEWKEMFWSGSGNFQLPTSNFQLPTSNLQLPNFHARMSAGMAPRGDQLVQSTQHGGKCWCLDGFLLPRGPRFWDPRKLRKTNLSQKLRYRISAASFSYSCTLYNSLPFLC